MGTVGTVGELWWEKLEVLSGNILEISVFIYSPSIHHLETCGAEPSVRGKGGPLWVRIVFNCFNFYSIDISIKILIQIQTNQSEFRSKPDNQYIARSRYHLYREWKSTKLIISYRFGLPMATHGHYTSFLKIPDILVIQRNDLSIVIENRVIYLIF